MIKFNSSSVATILTHTKVVMKMGKYMLAAFRRMPAFQRRAWLSVVLYMACVLIYFVSYAALRLNGCFIRGSNTDYGTTMYAVGASWDSERAAYFDGSVHMWDARNKSHLHLHALRFYSPLIRVENVLRDQYWKYR